MGLYLGVDGGNTKTLAVVSDASGEVLGVGRAGNGDIYGADSPEAAMEAVREAVAAAISSAGGGHIEFGTFSIAGADWPEDFDYIASSLQDLCADLRVVHDSFGALRAGTQDGVGVAVICGTYGTCGAMGPTGARWQGSFWHRAEGGAVPLGQAATEHVFDAEVGMVPPTTLRETLLEFYGESSVEDLLHRFTRREGTPRRADGAVAALLLAAALEGDRGAQSVVEAQGFRAGLYAAAAASQVGLSGEFPLVLAGGVLRFRPNPLEEVIVRTVRERHPHVTPARPRFEPMVGALMLSLDRAGITVGPEVERRLIETGPSQEFYDSRQ